MGQRLIVTKASRFFGVRRNDLLSLPSGYGIRPSPSNPNENS